MEVLRKIKKSNGIVYRIYDNNIHYHIYEIEFFMGTAWHPAFGPKNELYTKLEDAIARFEMLLED